MLSASSRHITRCTRVYVYARACMFRNLYNTVSERVQCVPRILFRALGFFDKKHNCCKETLRSPVLCTLDPHRPIPSGVRLLGGDISTGFRCIRMLRRINRRYNTLQWCSCLYVYLLHTDNCGTGGGSDASGNFILRRLPLIIFLNSSLRKGRFVYCNNVYFKVWRNQVFLDINQ